MKSLLEGTQFSREEGGSEQRSPGYWCFAVGPPRRATEVGMELRGSHTGWDLARDGELKSLWLYPLSWGLQIDPIFPNLSPTAS